MTTFLNTYFEFEYWEKKKLLQVALKQLLHIIIVIINQIKESCIVCHCYYMQSTPFCEVILKHYWNNLWKLESLYWTFME